MINPDEQPWSITGYRTLRENEIGYSRKFSARALRGHMCSSLHHPSVSVGMDHSRHIPSHRRPFLPRHRLRCSSHQDPRNRIHRHSSVTGVAGVVASAFLSQPSSSGQRRCSIFFPARERMAREEEHMHFVVRLTVNRITARSDVS